MESAIITQKDFAPPSPAAKPKPQPQPDCGKCFFRVQFTFRLLAAVFSVVAIAVMVTSHQTVKVFGLILEARYSYSVAFKFLVAVEAVVIALSVFSLFFVSRLMLRKPHPMSYFVTFLHDLVVGMLLMGACASATSIGLVGKNGQVQTAWMPICNQVAKFCNKNTLSMAFAYLALICYIVLTVSSVYKLSLLAKQE